jgi:hypothetical protein
LPFRPPQGFFPSSEETAFKPYYDAYIDVIETNRTALGTYYEKCVLGSRKNRNTKILRVVAEMNAQTAILELVNAYGVVIPLPKSLQACLPNFVKLMDPFDKENTDESIGVCRDNGRQVYPNVSKWVQIVCFSCMQSEKLKLPFKFSWSDKDVSAFFGTKREVSGASGASAGQYWKCIEKGETAEHVLYPRFVLKGNRKPMSLLALLDAICKVNLSEKESWSRWDELLTEMPVDFCLNPRQTAIKIMSDKQDDGNYVGSPSPQKRKPHEQHQKKKKKQKKELEAGSSKTKEGGGARGKATKEDCSDDHDHIADDNIEDDHPDEFRGQHQILCKSVLDSIPDSEWERVDSDRFVTDRVNAGINHIHKAMLEYSVVRDMDMFLPTKESVIKQHCQETPAQGFASAIAASDFREKLNTLETITRSFDMFGKDKEEMPMSLKDCFATILQNNEQSGSSPPQGAAEGKPAATEAPMSEEEERPPPTSINGGGGSIQKHEESGLSPSQGHSTRKPGANQKQGMPKHNHQNRGFGGASKRKSMDNTKK